LASTLSTWASWRTTCCPPPSARSADWAELDAAFAANRDPPTGHEPEEGYRSLFRKIKTVFKGRLGYAYFSPSWTAFQADRGRHFKLIVDAVSG